MAEIDGGSLSFKSIMDNDQLNSAIEETLRRVQGFSDAVVGAGDTMDSTTQDMIAHVRNTLGQIGEACTKQEQALDGLGQEYERLGNEMERALASGRYDEYRAIQEQRNAIKGEIMVRQQLLKDLRDQSNVLEEEATKLEVSAKQAENAAQSHASLRGRIRELKEEMALYREQFGDQTDKYREMTAELGRLMDIQGDIQAQGSILANDEANFQGFIQGLSGIAGGFSAATGAISLFAGENENLQRVMTKVQSVMAIAIGMQQVAQTLNKDSAFRLVTVRKAKELLTVAEMKFATALGISNVAAKALMATLTLGLSVAITGAIVLIDRIISKNKEAKKAQEEFNKAMIDGCYKSIGKVEELSLKWNALGDNLKAKKQFVEENKKAFEELGVAVLDVADAERVLNSGKDAFIAAQIEKAKAVVYAQQAQEKVKTLMENEQKIKIMPKTKSKWVQTSSFGTGYYIEVKNEEREKLIQANKDLEGEIKKGYEDAAIAESNGLEELKKAGIKSAKTKLDVNKDPFLEKLSKRKAEYQQFNKWLNSGDAILVASANKEFEGLLKEGSTYIDYLKKQRDQILAVDVANRTKEQNKQLRQLNDTIAEETENTVLEAFNNELSEQLSNAKTTLEMLKIIEQKRKELSGDGTELDNAKQDALNYAEKSTKNKLQEETEALLAEYASYAEQKRRIDEAYNRDYEILMAKRTQATTDAERAEIDASIAKRQKKRDNDVNSIGGIDYNAMLAEYGTFEQRKQAIIDEYEEKRRAAQAVGNTEMVEALNKAQAEALSKFALDELQAHPDWELMFGDLDEISTKKLQELIDKINGLDGAYLGIEFDPKDLETLKRKIEEMKDEIQERNPFKALISSIKDYGEAANDESKKKALTNMFESASSAIDLIGGTLDAVTSGLEKMGVTMDEETQAIVNDIGGIIEGAGQLASGIATGNPLAIIQGSISLLTSAFDLFNSKDRGAERRVKRHQQAIKDLGNAYNQLERQINKALGADVYDKQVQAIRNMEQQRQHLQKMMQAEEGKKKPDQDKINEYKEQYDKLGWQIEDSLDGMRKSLLDTDVKSIASQLGDAIVGAFENGKDAAAAWGDTVKNIVNNLVKNMLIQKVLQEPIDKLVSKYTSKWVNEKDGFGGFDNVSDDIDNLASELKGLYPSLEHSINALKDKLNLSSPDKDTSLTGAVKGVTEETASIVAGQMNAIRINQLEATTILRQSLLQLNTIAANTQYNRYLVKIDRIISLLESSGNNLRSQGLS